MSFRADADRFITAACLAVSKNFDLQRCTKQSIIQCVYDAAKFGLEVNNHYGHAYLIPYENRSTGRHICTLQIGYKGLSELAWRTGLYLPIEMHSVGPRDAFELARDNEGTKFRHVPDYEGDDWTDADIRFVYCVIRLKEFPKDPMVEVMNRAQVEKVRQVAKAGGVWRSHWEMMARKTVLKRAVGRIKISPELADAIDYDNRANFPQTTIAPSDENGTDGLAKRLKASSPGASLPAPPTDAADLIDSSEPIDIEPEEAPPVQAAAPPEPKTEPKTEAKPKGKPAAAAKPAPEPPPADPLVEDATDDETWDLGRQ